MDGATVQVHKDKLCAARVKRRLQGGTVMAKCPEGRGPSASSLLLLLLLLSTAGGKCVSATGAGRVLGDVVSLQPLQLRLRAAWGHGRLGRQHGSETQLARRLCNQTSTHCNYSGCCMHSVNVCVLLMAFGCVKLLPSRLLPCYGAMQHAALHLAGIGCGESVSLQAATSMLLVGIGLAYTMQRTDGHS